MLDKVEEFYMPRQEDLAYVAYEFEAKGFKCFYEPFERDRPDMIAIGEEKILVIELKTGRESSSIVFNQMIWMKKYKEELYRKLSNRKVEFVLVTPNLRPSIQEKLEKEGIKVLLRPVPGI